MSDEQYAEAEQLIIKHLDIDPEDLELTIQLANVYGLNKSHNKVSWLVQVVTKRLANIHGLNKSHNKVSWLV